MQTPHRNILTQIKTQDLLAVRRQRKPLHHCAALTETINLEKKETKLDQTTASHMSADAVSSLSDCDTPKCDQVKVIPCDT